MRLRREEALKAGQTPAPARKAWGRPIAESLAALALSSAIGCAHTQERIYDPPRGSIALYSLQDGIQSERVAIGNDINVFIRADVRVVQNGGVVSLRDLETTGNGSGLTFCWFIFQDIGLGPDSNPTYFLLNPRYKDYNQPRYIGAAVFRTDDKGKGYAVVVPARHDETAPQDAGWSAGPIPKARESFLFRLHRNTLIPRLDAHAIYRMPDYCRETASPEIAVAEYGRTVPVLAVYPDRQ